MRASRRTANEPVRGRGRAGDGARALRRAGGARRRRQAHRPRRALERREPAGHRRTASGPRRRCSRQRRPRASRRRTRRSARSRNSARDGYRRLASSSGPASRSSRSRSAAASWRRDQAHGSAASAAASAAAAGDGRRRRRRTRPPPRRTAAAGRPLGSVAASSAAAAHGAAAPRDDAATPPRRPTAPAAAHASRRPPQRRRRLRHAPRAPPATRQSPRAPAASEDATDAPRARARSVASRVAIARRVARAQSKDDIARADALFNAAKALTDSGQYADACAKFAESKRLAPGLGVTMYLADCYEHIGRTASAWTEFRAAEGLARARNDKRADVARQHAQALEPKLDRLTISVAPSVPRVGLIILRDGVPVTHRGARARGPGRSGRSRRRRLGAGSRAAHTQRARGTREPRAPRCASTASTRPRRPAVRHAGAGSPAPAEPAQTGAEQPPTDRRIAEERGASSASRGWASASSGSASARSSASWPRARSTVRTTALRRAATSCNPPACPTGKDASRQGHALDGVLHRGRRHRARRASCCSSPRRTPASTPTGMTLTPAPMTGGGGALLSGSF